MTAGSRAKPNLRALPYLEAHMAMTASSEDMGDRIAYDRALAAIENATVSPPDA